MPTPDLLNFNLVPDNSSSIFTRLSSSLSHFPALAEASFFQFIIHCKCFYSIIGYNFRHIVCYFVIIRNLDAYYD